MPEDFQNLQNENNNQDYNQALNQPQPQQPLSRNQKIAAGVLAVFAALVIGLWAAQFKNNISQPFAYNANNANIESQTVGEENSDAALKAKDTDKDGLSDYDELNIYNTSPYLEDSDSDGFKDKEEIDSGKDPNCPVGRDCQASGLVNEKAATEEQSQEQSSLNTMFNQLGYGATASSTNSAGVTPSEEELKAVVGSQMDAATLRQLLLQNGMDEQTLSQISDEDLMNSFQEVLKK